MSQPATRHVVRRTSPKGEQFLGVCTMCGTEGLTIRDANTECPNPLGRTFQQAWADTERGKQ